MARYRIRFQMQEIDLASGETLLGRSPECHVTIEDPLVSRRHARIVIQDQVPVIQDLGSRNGLRINGALIRGEAPLADGDRVRIGTQELVFCQVPECDVKGVSRTTGYLLYCAHCRYPYPEEMLACPNCGGRDRIGEETTLSGVTTTGQSNWAIQLLAEVLERALSMDRVAEAERAMARARTALDERVALGHRIEQPQLDSLAAGIVRYARSQNNTEWLIWVLHAYARGNCVPAQPVVAMVRDSPFASLEPIVQAAEQIAKKAVGIKPQLTEAELDGLDALEQWRCARAR